jgi:hypothetical protein
MMCFALHWKSLVGTHYVTISILVRQVLVDAGAKLGALFRAGFSAAYPKPLDVLDHIEADSFGAGGIIGS